jgi:hypothetical protein
LIGGKPKENRTTCLIGGKPKENRTKERRLRHNFFSHNKSLSASVAAKFERNEQGWIPVAKCRFHKKKRIHSNAMFSFPLRLSLLISAYNLVASVMNTGP